MSKEEIAQNEQFLLSPQCFPLLVIGYPFNYRDFLLFDEICLKSSAAELSYEGKDYSMSYNDVLKRTQTERPITTNMSNSQKPKTSEVYNRQTPHNSFIARPTNVKCTCRGSDKEGVFSSFPHNFSLIIKANPKL